MSDNTHRQTLLNTLFPNGVPRLWCPVLSHFQADRRIDSDRMAGHFEAISPFVKGIMLHGSTGEGWDLNETQNGELLGTALQLARRFDQRVLIGVLRTELDQMLAVIEGTVSWLCEESGQASGMAAMLAHNVVGFTVCPPKGAGLTQGEIQNSLTAVLELGHPTALYQLPQVTGNEMSPECVSTLAAQYPNFYLLKDTSGVDRVALAGLDLQGVYLVRGAEGQYDRWLRDGGGVYDGYLLSSANCFAQELAQVIELSGTQFDDAAHLAHRIENVIDCCFELVADYPAANPFTNANKIIDHVMAFGDQALSEPPPFLSSGEQLPKEFIEQTHQVLEQQHLLPRQGYL